MTPDEINKAVAVKVMGWHLDSRTIDEHSDYPYIKQVWSNSNERAQYTVDGWQPYTNREQALQVVDRMIELEYEFHADYSATYPSQKKSWFVMFTSLDIGVDGQSLPALICEAALKAVG